MLKMMVSGLAAFGIAFLATAAQAAPFGHGGAVERLGAAPVQSVQFYDDPYDGDYAPPPVYRPRYRAYRAPPSDGYFYQPRPVYRAPAYGFYDREDAKDYVKSYRRAQKDILKDRARAWNRSHGY